jgi:hemerythrin-like metal-binding protein
VKKIAANHLPAELIHHLAAIESEPFFFEHPEHMMELTWTRRMSVGNESIDTEHKTLLKMVNDIERAISKRDSAALARTFRLLEEAVHNHFRNEARIAQAINYPFEEHTLEHQYVLNELQSMRDELVSNEGRWSESAVEHYYGFLSEWTTMHIGEDDMRMKEILDTYPYNFEPPISPK